MLTVLRITAALVFVLAAAALAGCDEWNSAELGAGQTREARVTRVVDGDTIHLEGIGSSRIIGVDTPETEAGPECFGYEAAAFTAERLPPGTTVTYRFGEEPRDRFGRALVYVWEPDGTFFNEQLVRHGFASALSIRPNTEFAERFERLAARARELGEGLWAPDQCGPDGH